MSTTILAQMPPLVKGVKAAVDRKVPPSLQSERQPFQQLLVSPGVLLFCPER